MRRRLIAGFLVFALVLVVLLEVPLGVSLADNARATAFSELRRDASSLSLVAASSLGRHRPAAVVPVLQRYAGEEGSVVLVEQAGRVLARGGRHSAEEARDPRTRRIVARASRGRVSGEEVTRDGDDDLLYMAVPVPTTARSSVVLLIAEPAGPLHHRIAEHWLALGLFGAAVLAVAAGLGTLMARSLARPIAQIGGAVAALGAGSLSERVPVRRRPAELRALGEAVNEMADRLQELLHSQRAFVADASHQLRTPMTALRLRLENLEGDLGEHGGDLALAIAEVDRLSRLVDGLLALARAEGTRPARLRVEVATVAKERAEVWSALAAERQLTLDYELTPGETAALACDGCLEQVLDNLLSNALEATPSGGSVELRVEPAAGRVEVHVVDTGPGMRPNERERAFDRFWRGGGDSQGSGLGLAIVAQLVRASGGMVRLDSSPAGGVDAVVSLEAVRAAPAHSG